MSAPHSTAPPDGSGHDDDVCAAERGPRHEESGLTITLVAAMDEMRIIGTDNTIPWNLPADMAHFRAVTMGHTMLMGRLTHESIGKPLPGRTTMVMSRRPGYAAAGCVVVDGVRAAFDTCRKNGVTDLMVVGGADIYQQLMPHARRMELTRIHGRFAGDVRFPAWSPDEWAMVACTHREADGSNGFAVDFETWWRS